MDYSNNIQELGNSCVNCKFAEFVFGILVYCHYGKWKNHPVCGMTCVKDYEHFPIIYTKHVCKGKWFDKKE